MGDPSDPRDEAPAIRLPRERRPTPEVANGSARTRLRDHPRVPFRPRIPRRVAGRECGRLRVPAATPTCVPGRPSTSATSRSRTGGDRSRGWTTDGALARGLAVESRQMSSQIDPPDLKLEGDLAELTDASESAIADSILDAGVMWQRAGLDEIGVEPTYSRATEGAPATFFSQRRKCRSPSSSQRSSSTVDVSERREGHPTGREERPRVSVLGRRNRIPGSDRSTVEDDPHRRGWCHPFTVQACDRRGRWPASSTDPSRAGGPQRFPRRVDGDRYA